MGLAQVKTVIQSGQILRQYGDWQSMPATISTHRRRTMMKPVSTNNKYRQFFICGDIASVIFVGYWVYFFVWASMHPGPTGKPMPLQLKLLLADILPSVFAGVWFSYRYVTAWSKKYPLLVKLANNERFRLTMLIVAITATMIATHMRR
jgi:hypothetical protein